MNKLRAILVDDEESARDVLQNLLVRFCPEVDLVAKCGNLPEAVEMIRNEKPDIVFLDIEMPNYAGFEIVNFIEAPDFEIIFVTAYDQYAVRAFEMAAIDYLLKPVEISRLKLAVERAAKQRDIEKQAQRLSLLGKAMESKEIRNIVVTDKGQQHVLPLDEIIAIEAQESYCLIHTSQRNYVVSRNLKHFETLLETLPRFIRVHKSWLINRDHLKHYSRSEFSIHLANGIIARLSKYKKAEFEAAINF